MPNRTTRYALAQDLVVAMFHSYYNSLIRDARDCYLPARLSFAADEHIPAELRVPVTDLWGHKGTAVTVTQGDLEVDIQVPPAPEVFQVILDNRYKGLNFEESRTAIAHLLSECADAAGLPNLCMIANTPVVPPGVWAAYREAVEQYLPIFERADTAFQAHFAQLIHKYAAVNLLLVAAGTEDDNIARSKIAASRKAAEAAQRQDILQTLAAHEKRLDQRVENLAHLADEVTILLQLYWIHHFEAGVMPGPDDQPVWRFLPPDLHRRLRRRSELPPKK